MINIVQDVTRLDHRFHLVIRVVANGAIPTVLTQDRILDPIPLNVTPGVRAVLDIIQAPETVEHVRLCLQ